MKMLKVSFLVMTMLGLLIFTQNTANAEVSLNFYLGWAFTGEEDVEVDVDGISFEGEADFEDSFTFGGRVAYWLENMPWLGLALDLSYFAPDSDDLDADVSVVPLSFLVMFRGQLMKSSAFPNGQLHPYFGIGPGIFFSSIDFDDIDIRENGIEFGLDLDDNSTDVGLDVRAGLAWFYTLNWDIFFEYRFTSVEAEFDGDVRGVIYGERVSEEFDVEPELNTHHFLVGLSYHF